jgi:hypothetical protein
MANHSKIASSKNTAEQPEILGQIEAEDIAQPSYIQEKCLNHNELTSNLTVSLEYTTGRGMVLNWPLLIGVIGGNIGRDIDVEAE